MKDHEAPDAFVVLRAFRVRRVAGKRALSQTTTFDLVLALVISESIQQALLDHDPSLTHATLVVIGLVGFDILVSYAAHRSSTLRKLLEGSPVVLIEAGRMHPKYMDRERVGESEIMQSARDKHGLARLEQVAYAVVEQSGDITIVPTEKTGRRVIAGRVGQSLLLAA